MPTSEYDFETISSVLYSLVSTVLVAVISLYACFPESKISQKIGKGLKKVIPSAFSSPVVIAEGNDSEVVFLLIQFFFRVIELFLGRRLDRCAKQEK